MAFSETLRSLLEEQGLTQKQLALDLNITQSTLGGYIQGTREPDFDTLKLFAKYFRVSTDYLLGYSLTPGSVPGEQEILRIYRSLDAEQRELYIEQGKVFLRLNKRSEPKKKSS